MKRRFVNLVMNNFTERTYSLRRIDIHNQFFYESARAALEAADDAAKKKKSFPAIETLQLPPPCANFTAATEGGIMSMFALLNPRGASEGRIVYADPEGKAGLYDADKNSHNAMVSPNEPKGIDPVCLPVVNPDDPGQSIMYVLNREPGRSAGDRCFEVLESVPTAAAALCGNKKATWWRWQLLRPPPFVLKDNYRDFNIASHATKVDGNGYSTIYVTADFGGGTYSFETSRLDTSERLGWRRTEKWSRVGEWALPFVDRAEYVPDFNLWFGFFGYRSHHLCAVDLFGLDTSQHPVEGQTV